MDKWRKLELKAMCRRFRNNPKDKQQIIRDAAKQADAVEYESILRSVTQGTPWERSGAYCGRTQFYNIRAAFFRLLDRMLRDAGK